MYAYIFDCFEIFSNFMFEYEIKVDAIITYISEQLNRLKTIFNEIKSYQQVNWISNSNELNMTNRLSVRPKEELNQNKFEDSSYKRYFIRKYLINF